MWYLRIPGYGGGCLITDGQWWMSTVGLLWRHFLDAWWGVVQDACVISTGERTEALYCLVGVKSLAHTFFFFCFFAWVDQILPKFPFMLTCLLPCHLTREIRPFDMFVYVGPVTTGTFKLLASAHIWEFQGRENNLGTYHCAVHWVPTISSWFVFSPSFRIVCLYHASLLVVLVVVSRRNEKKYIYSIFPEWKLYSMLISMASHFLSCNIFSYGLFF